MGRLETRPDVLARGYDALMTCSDKAKANDWIYLPWRENEAGRPPGPINYPESGPCLLGNPTCVAVGVCQSSGMNEPIKLKDGVKIELYMADFWETVYDGDNFKHHGVPKMRMAWYEWEMKDGHPDVVFGTRVKWD